MECKYCEKNNNCAIQKSFTEEEIGCSKGILTIKAQKELNAFQIIKEKQVQVDWFIHCSKNFGVEGLHYYNNAFVTSVLTQEEYELLKEVLL